MSGRQMEDEHRQIPVELIPHVLRFNSLVVVLSLVATFVPALHDWAGSAFFVSFASLVVGLFTVPVTYLLYEAITLLFLRGFQWLRLVEPTFAE